MWDGAVVLARYIEAASSGYGSQRAGIPGSACVAVRGPKICIELGAGTGLAGLAAAQALQVRTRSEMAPISNAN